MRNSSKSEELINSLQVGIDKLSKECEELSAKYTPLYNDFLKMQEKCVKLNTECNDLAAEKELWHGRCTELYAQEITLKNKVTFLERYKETVKKDIERLLERDKQLRIDLDKIPKWVRWIFCG